MNGFIFSFYLLWILVPIRSLVIISILCLSSLRFKKSLWEQQHFMWLRQRKLISGFFFSLNQKWKKSRKLALLLGECVLSFSLIFYFVEIWKRGVIIYQSDLINIDFLWIKFTKLVPWKRVCFFKWTYTLYKTKAYKVLIWYSYTGNPWTTWEWGAQTRTQSKFCI